MKKYEILPHPAELRLRIYGKTIEELFINAAFALAKIQGKNIALRRRSSMKCYKKIIKIQSVDINSLLVDFLSEILAKSQINKCVYLMSNVNCQMSGVKAELKATLIGFPVDRFDEDIKAVTYQDVDIKLITQNSLLKTKLWQTELVFDI